MWDSIVIGAGQAGLSTSFHLRRLGVPHVVLDANPHPGGAWQHRWDALTMADVNGIADLPNAPLPPADGPERANVFVPGYFSDYERHHDLPVERPVVVRAVLDDGGVLRVESKDGRTWHSRTLVNATGTWRRPFLPHYPGRESFRGEQLHTSEFPAPEHFRGKRVLVVGGGISAVQFLGLLRPITDTVWVTRREPVWHTGEFDEQAGREAVARVEERVRRGLPPRSVVSVTGLLLRPQEQEAARLGAYERRPMFERIEPDGVRWAGGTFEPVDAIIWATGFRPDVEQLAPLHLRSPWGGIQLGDTLATSTTAVADPRIQLVGYGPSASTIGANRAGRVAARAVARQLEPAQAS
ncbi:NAD(P)-binding domain-containing protein [Aeromicrobium duanguangcaii]|uniref:NAD(P)/FAD-dependent oxidoreductase n=1 Tax=Aeromicrobium duanguangcaii TaxID=2968086 RepID=A0ABY5KBA7_9ACTN|nr:NAD(P)-binding domain-containing protein [Aeromicrobium duanguangcaii]MCD9155000.1 NAD(P)/FAD-dependent oxidoreductase [Aeromicrobium duanguangcaii]UUI67595.1 NAD(P)/FAD-dependent oxidoreductase [Aeromicrobium duanguangcaii]